MSVRNCNLYSCLLVISLCLIITLPVYAQPDPYPANPALMEYIEQINADSMEATVETLIGFHTRHTFSDTLSDETGIGAAFRWFENECNRLNEGADRIPWTYTWRGTEYTRYNLLFGRGGTPDGYPSFILVGAHLDSRTVDINDTEGFAPGADDDASGIACLLEYLRVFPSQTFLRSVMYCAFTGEEQGLIGSNYVADMMEECEWPLGAMINLDMIAHISHPDGTIDSMTVRAYSENPQGSHGRQFARYVKWIGEAYAEGMTVTMVPAIDRPGRGGDHIPFTEHGFTAMRLIETAEDPAYQHNPNDTPEHMSFSYLHRVARLTGGVIATLADAPMVPPEPIVHNTGEGTSLLVILPEDIPDTTETIFVGYRTEDETYWEGISPTSADTDSLFLEGLTEGETYCISISIAYENGCPSLFSEEVSATPCGGLLPPDAFETTSTQEGIELVWEPREELNITGYEIERGLTYNDFEAIAQVPHPQGTYFDTNIETGPRYKYRIRSIHTEGDRSSPSPEEWGRLASHHLGILLVDATSDGDGSPGRPYDVEIDTFYEHLLSNFDIAGQWDIIQLNEQGRFLDDSDLAAYRIALVYSESLTNVFTTENDEFRKYHANGGKLIFVGWQMASKLEHSSTYDTGYGEGDFVYDMLGIDSTRITPPNEMEMQGVTILPYNTTRRFDEERFPEWNGVLPVSEAIWTDSLPEGVEVFGLFSAVSGDEYEFHGRPVAIIEQGEYPEYSSWAFIDVPTYYLQWMGRHLLLHYALTEMGEVSYDVDEREGMLPDESALHILGTYPNPFNGWTVVEFSLPQPGDVHVELFNLLGQRVFNTSMAASQCGYYQYTINAESLPSGVYYVQVQSHEWKDTQKITLVR